MEMFGNGALTIGTITIKMRRQMVKLGCLINRRVFICCAVVLGAAIQGYAVVPFAVVLSQTTGTITLGFGLFMLWREFFSDTCIL
jgi:hypothetical protein